MATIFTLNEGPFDRTLRVILGVALLSLTFLGPRTLWGLLGLVPVITGFAGTCPYIRSSGFEHAPLRRTRHRTDATSCGR